MELHDEEIYERASVNLSVILNDDIKEEIIENLRQNMKDRNVKISSYDYGSIHKINYCASEVADGDERGGGHAMLMHGWLKKMKVASSVVIFCVDWQGIANEGAEDRNLTAENLPTGGSSQEIPTATNPSGNTPLLGESPTGENYPLGSPRQAQPEPTRACVQNAAFMNQVNKDLMERIEEINAIIMRRKKICKIVVLVILPENTQNTEEYIKYISLLNSKNISAIFITLGLKEIHNKIRKLENLLRDCINAFFKQHIISFERKSGQSILNFFKYNFKKAYVLEILERYDESMKIYVNLCKVFYEHAGENTFSDKQTFFKYVIFFNSISIRMIYIYLFFKDIKKAIHHIYTHNKIIYLALMRREEEHNNGNDEEEAGVGDLSRIGAGLSHVISMYGITGCSDLITSLKCWNNFRGNALINGGEKYPANENVHLLYDLTMKEYLYYNLLSCIYFYFYRIVKNININIRDTVLYGIYCCFCIYYMLKARRKMDKIVEGFSPITQFESYFKMCQDSSVQDFVLNFLIEIYVIISTKQISNLFRLVIYFLCLIYYERGNYPFCLYLLLSFYGSGEDSSVLSAVSADALREGIYPLGELHTLLGVVSEKRSYERTRNSHTHEPMLLLTLSCMGRLLHPDMWGTTADGSSSKKEPLNIKEYQHMFIQICFEYLNDLIRNKKRKEEKNFCDFFSKYCESIKGKGVLHPDGPPTISIGNVYVKLYCLIKPTGIAFFLEIKNETHVDFHYSPIMGISMNNHLSLYKLNFSNKFDGVIFATGEVLYEVVVNGKSVLDCIDRENASLEGFSLGEKNIVSFFLPGISKKEIEVNYVDLYLNISCNIVRMRIHQVGVSILREEFLERVSMGVEHPKVDEESSLSKVRDADEKGSPQKGIQNHGTIDTPSRETTHGVITASRRKESKKAERKIFQMRVIKEGREELNSFKLKEGVYLNYYMNKIVPNGKSKFIQKALKNYVHYFLHCRNDVLYQNEYNPLYIFVRYSKYIKSFEFRFSYGCEGEDHVLVYTLTRKGNVLRARQVCRDKAVEFFGEGDQVCRLVEGGSSDCSVGDSSSGNSSSGDSSGDDNSNESCTYPEGNLRLFLNQEEVKELVMDKALQELLSHRDSGQVDSKLSSPEKDVFFFQLEQHGNHVNSKRSGRKLYGRSNFCNECCMSYGMKRGRRSRNTCGPNGRADHGRSDFPFYAGVSEKVMCVPLLVYPTGGSKHVNVNFDFSFKSANFEDQLKYPGRYSVEPSVITMVTRIGRGGGGTIGEEEGKKEEEDGGLKRCSTNASVMNSGSSDEIFNSTYTPKYCQEDEQHLRHRKKGETGTEGRDDTVQYYLYIHNNNSHGIIVEEIRGGTLKGTVEVTHKSTYCNIVKGNNSEGGDIIIKYHYNIRNLFFPFKKMWENIIRTLVVKVPPVHPIDDRMYGKEGNHYPLMKDMKKSKIRIDLFYEKTAKCNEIFVVESVITNETNITEEVIIFLYERKRGRRSQRERRMEKGIVMGSGWDGARNTQSRKKMYELKFKNEHEYYSNNNNNNSNNNMSEGSSDSSVLSSDNLEDLIDEDNYMSDGTNDHSSRKRYIITGGRIMKNILLPYQSIKLRWSFLIFAHGFVTLPSVLIKRKTKIKNNINVFASASVELFVV
ncbi:conserved Plasmodium protein, unknown function [Plasmodium knowlesi strain H]|uniref:Uncharacterized protein n=3 Tax=Plasmodium knowlesi TaxID=5850 RepID=A0A5K1VSJ7_PLAKH|nr:conserved Plasmodium protein, unknown function [Plasmodium knowlesi strain H]OTN68169.1 Uncharacterized protein PKNOH_S04341700 [Plasmodium knowlesi]CAA9990269.1 conserved Plasmodium protein, unknown function [Plasmodium knowlesi strain H]SBO26760.1 conserved Plasmodium protein, unknown function [Plasmodium knowlesi strain H]SBO28410.1 conserved Plasmodium protein, unknown function [Plasmodium knowlesi strain H]VVS79743.1 conserved Plasmodium protein, unknown function [Plasmodium knowlesi s|eukprot:XP_002258032.1 hypothetical protein, conserved in Plasmodium species [Plasmodium knowlesi strain H]